MLNREEVEARVRAEVRRVLVEAGRKQAALLIAKGASADELIDEASRFAREAADAERRAVEEVERVLYGT